MWTAITIIGIFVLFGMSYSISYDKGLTQSQMYEVMTAMQQVETEYMENIVTELEEL